MMPDANPIGATVRLFFSLVVLVGTSAGAATKNGFDLGNSTVPKNEIRLGGPPRDGIVALTHPTMVPATQAPGLKPDARVLGVSVSGEAHAYPENMLTVHEIVNGQIGSQHYTVTFCPLCGSGVAFATNVGQSGSLNFGVSGLLYNSDMLMYDRNTESLWSQITGKAISGPLVNTSLPRLAVWHMSWALWKNKFPNTTVMQGVPRYRRLYRSNPYPGYRKTKRLYFPVNQKAPKDFHPKEFVLGIEVDGAFKAYPFSALRALGADSFTDSIGGRNFVVHWDGESESAWLDDNTDIQWMRSFWFAWYAFHPQTLVYSGANSEVEK